MTTLRVTFYSYKGGVGRTIALLNVARILAGHGFRVVAVDMDLEAPGFGLLSDKWVERREVNRGVSDLMLGRMAGDERPLDEFFARPTAAFTAGDLRLMTAGTRPEVLSARIPELLEDVESEEARVFQYFAAEIEETVEPDFILFDSRTGLADIAGVCTLELPDLLVVVCGLNDQNVKGTEGFLERWFAHPARYEDTGVILCISPVPRDVDLERWGEPPVEQTVKEIAEGLLPRERAPKSRRLFGRYVQVQEGLLVVLGDKRGSWQLRFPELLGEDLVHAFHYDPLMALGEPFELSPESLLYREHRRLARSLSRAHDAGRELEADDAVRLRFMEHVLA